MSRPPDPHVGRILDQRYELVSLLAQGGMGTLYRAQTIDDEKRPVVIKFSRWGAALQTLRQHDPERAQLEEKGRVEREFLLLQKASSLSEHVVKVFEPLGEDRQLGLYYPMEFLDGTPLSELPEWGQPFDFEQALELVIQVGNALAVAHGIGVVHRDLNPENIFIVRQGEQERFVKLIDFGIARDLYQRRETFQTGDDLAFGHFNYMAPEQVGYNPVEQTYDTTTAALLDHRADIYSLGAILLHLFVGKPPFEDSTIEQLATRNWANPPTLRWALEEGLLPVGVSDLVLSCLHPLPDGRPPDIYVLNAMLDNLLTDYREGRLSGEEEDDDESDGFSAFFDWAMEEEESEDEEGSGSLNDLPQFQVPELEGAAFDVDELVTDSTDLLTPVETTAAYEVVKHGPRPVEEESHYHEDLDLVPPEATAAYSTISSIEEVQVATEPTDDIEPLLAAEAEMMSEADLPAASAIDATMEVSQAMLLEPSGEFSGFPINATMEVSQAMLLEPSLEEIPVASQRGEHSPEEEGDKNAPTFTVLPVASPPRSSTQLKAAADPSEHRHKTPILLWAGLGLLFVGLVVGFWLWWN